MVKVVADKEYYDFSEATTWEFSKDDKCLHILDSKNNVLGSFATWEAVFRV